MGFFTINYCGFIVRGFTVFLHLVNTNPITVCQYDFTIVFQILLYKSFYFKEIHCINESTLFLRNLIHDCGLRLKTNAITVQTRRIRDGFIEADSDEKCLVQSDWNLEKLEANISTLNRETLKFLEEHDKQILVSTASIKQLQTHKADDQGNQ